jgi:hypothetical protein
MGGGGYSLNARSVRSESLGYETKAVHEIFTSKKLDIAMDPAGAQLRESCDSEEHPNSVAIGLSLDLTGSMGSIPHHMVKEGLPHIMGTIIQRGIADPQLLFMGIGDHECDRAPLQVGQFESNDELLDKWLTDIYIEGGGGGNNGESYMLAWYFAARHTSIDCWNKRKQKGFLFTIGDEPVLKELPAAAQKKIMEHGQFSDVSSAVLLEEAQVTYHVYHLHVKQGSHGRSEDVMGGWKQLLGDNLIIVDDTEDIPKVIADIVASNVNTEITTAPDVEESAVTDTAEAKPPAVVEEML